MPVQPISSTPLEIACDESGFTGGNLTFRHAVFAHASLQVSREEAAAEMARLRQRVAARGELKASWLLRWCTEDDLHRLLGPDGLLAGGVLVHLSDIRLFLLNRLTDVLLGHGDVNGLDLPGREASARETALLLHREGEPVFGTHRWQDFLTAAGHLLRRSSRWVPATAVEDFEDAAGALAFSCAPSAVRQALVQLHAAASRARAIRSSLEADLRRPPLLEPLLPAVTRAALSWGALNPALVVLHDEQSALTRPRVAGIAHRLMEQHPGHTLTLARVDSKVDPRVQVADLVAGIARRAAAGLLTGRSQPELVGLIRPLVDPMSIWASADWQPTDGPSSSQAGRSPGVAS